uniref:Myotubularinlike protein putative n=1 Tax=Albugo laibachii Nc14 TaxID=890382 RepID=F0WT95_9STRA|nr:myotubularinlike protein putative [Albugo laibachii Nc14]|eukprot:CCA24584.1 myotubularinlike protein putative [Albugo laibachii Nc14]
MPELLVTKRKDDKSDAEMPSAVVEDKCQTTGACDPPNALTECADRRSKFDNQKLSSVLEETDTLKSVYPIQDEGTERGDCLREGSASFFSKIPRLEQIRSSISRSSFTMSRSDSPKKKLEMRSESLGPALFSCAPPSRSQEQTAQQCSTNKRRQSACLNHTRERSNDASCNVNREFFRCQDQGPIYTFCVRKADNMFEKLGSKRSVIQVVVDLNAQMLTFLSPEFRESHSCADISIRPLSKLKLHLQIYTRNEVLSRKIVFENPEDREVCQHLLENEKSSSNSKFAPSNGTILADTEMEVSSTSTEAAQNWPHGYILNDRYDSLPGETIADHVYRVANLVVISQSDSAVQGVLRITTYRVTFTPYDPTWKFGSFEIPLAAIDIVTRDSLMISIACKDLRIIRLAMHDAYSKKNEKDQLHSIPDVKWLNSFIYRMQSPIQVDNLFAFEYYRNRCRDGIDGKEKRNEDGWQIYLPVAEYQRLKFLDRIPKMESESELSKKNIISRTGWRLLRNSNFRLSPSYPQLLVVPNELSDDELVQSAKFRSRARLPVVIWKHPSHNCVLARSSQPNYGMVGNRCEADRRLLKLFRDSANVSTSGASPSLSIIDARKPIATKGNRLRGKGVENPHHYDNARIEYLGIVNIHRMRESLDALKVLVSPCTIVDGDKHYHNRLENTRWLKHIMRVLSGARRIAELLHEDGASVLVHCSDGWDRTPQLVSLAQLILDPFYRTIRGFVILIEKEWCSFGHKFADRIGVGKDVSDQPYERSPVMLQFLDCVWQMTRQFPTCFEFNEKLLLHTVDALMSGLYGTFLYNTERERVFERIRERTESAWTPVLEHPQAFSNTMYKPTNRILYPLANLKRIVVWDALFFRWDAESHPDYAEFMGPATLENASYSYDVDDIGATQMSEVGLPSMPLEVEEMQDVEESQVKYVLSEISDISEEEPITSAESSSIVSSDPTPESCCSCESQANLVVRKIEQFYGNMKERNHQRMDSQNVSDVLQMATDHNRAKNLEKLLSESAARELRLEAFINSIYSTVESRQ